MLTINSSLMSGIAEALRSEFRQRAPRVNEIRIGEHIVPHGKANPPQTFSNRCCPTCDEWLY